MFGGRQRKHRLIYVLCMALLVAAMAGYYDTAHAAGGSISISGVSATTACDPGNVIVNLTLSVNIPSNEYFDLHLSFGIAGEAPIVDNPVGAFGSPKQGPVSKSGTGQITGFVGTVPANTIIAVRYYNASNPGEQAFVCLNCSTHSQTGCPSGSGGSNAFNITHFDPADGRIDGKPADRIVIYCNPAAKPPSIDIYGITDDGLGFLLGRFKFSLVVRAGTRGVLLRPVGKGKINLQVDANNNFYAAWNGGPYSATGTGDFAKSFTCPFTR